MATIRQPQKQIQTLRDPPKPDDPMEVLENPTQISPKHDVTE